MAMEDAHARPISYGMLTESSALLIVLPMPQPSQQQPLNLTTNVSAEINSNGRRRKELMIQHFWVVRLSVQKILTAQVLIRPTRTSPVSARLVSLGIRPPIAARLSARQAHTTPASRAAQRHASV